jgi:hypothetical protein
VQLVPQLNAIDPVGVLFASFTILSRRFPADRKESSPAKQVEKKVKRREKAAL